MAITLSYVANGKRQQLVWHVGSNTRGIKLVAAFSDYLQADGEELQYVLTTFENIPKCTADELMHSWFGDHARFIAANLQ